MPDILKVADEADMIVNGYAFTKCAEGYRVLNLNRPERAVVLSLTGKFFVKDNGDTILQARGILNDREIAKIQDFIKDNYKEMYLKWAEYSENGFYGKNNE